MTTDFTAALPRKRVGAAALLSDGQGRVLLVEPTYKDYWEIPGGAVDADEAPLAAVVRELKEELGLPVQPGRLLVTDWVPPRQDRTEGLMLVFDGGVLTPEHTAQIRLPAEELHSWAWCTMSEAETRLSQLLARRIAAAVRARDEGTTVYLENGSGGQCVGDQLVDAGGSAEGGRGDQRPEVGELLVEDVQPAARFAEQRSRRVDRQVVQAQHTPVPAAKPKRFDHVPLDAPVGRVDQYRADADPGLGLDRSAARLGGELTASVLNHAAKLDEPAFVERQ